MERKNKLNRKKRNIGNSMLSLILVFAMVFTNVQPSLITVQAAESETAVFDETAESGEVAQADDEQKTENNEDSQTKNDENEKIKETSETTEPSETVKSNETEETSETVKPSETEETSETVKSSETEQTSETTKPSETEEAGETTESTETVETAIETEEVTETVETETETEAETEQITADDEETVTIKAHFKNVTNWEMVAVHHWGGGIEETVWPGSDVTEKDEDGYFVVEIPNVKKTEGEEFGIIFNNRDGKQTSDIKIPTSDFVSNIYEIWAWVDEAGGTGWSKAPIVSPQIEKNTVTFRYINQSAETVLLAGNMNDWTADADSENAIRLVKGEDGIFTYTTKLQRDDYEYKFVVDGGWTADPNNDNKADGGNSKFSISTLLSPEIKEYDATFYYESDVETVLVAGSMNSWNENPESADAAKMTRNADGILTYTFTGLLPGDYTYKFIEIVDGNKNWVPDPNNDLMADDGFGGKNSLFTIGEDSSKIYEYTIHYYNPAVSDPVLDGPDILIWNGNASNGSGKAYSFTDIFDDEQNGIQWLTLTVKAPYKKIGMNGRPKAGKNTKDADRTYAVTSGEEKAELWYVYGKGIYDKKPMFGKVEKAEVSLQPTSVNYTQNAVLTLNLKGKDDTEISGQIREAYVDASDLGMSSKLYIDPELLEVTLSVRESVATGTYKLPVTVVDFYNTKIETSVDIEVTGNSNKDFDWDEAVIYFMVTDRFFDGNSGNNAANGAHTYGDNAGLYHGGDFAGVTAKLDYLKELGVNTIWITPIVDNIAGVEVGDGQGDVPFNSSYHGYWASDFTKLDPALGTEEEFKTLISQAHDNGIKIMVDVVLNHAGYDTEEYFNNLLKDEADNAIQMIRDDSQQVSGSDQQASLSGLPDFLTENEEVRNQVVQWQVDWMKKYAIDYFRVDTVKHVDSTTWSAFKNELTKENPNFKMIGEYYGAGHSWNGGVLGSGQMDSVLDFNFNEYATDFVKGSISSVESNLRDRNRTLNNTYMTGQFLSSHDEVGFKQNLLDQKWENAAAEAAALVAATLQITAKGQPVIYYGEEIGQTGENNYPYQTNRYDFKWADAEKQKNDTNSVYNHYKTLLTIRNQYMEIFAKGDRQSVDLSDSKGYDVISRSYNGETIYIGMNINKSEAQTIIIPVNNKGVSAYKDLYSETKNGTTKEYVVSSDGKIEIEIPAATEGGTVILVPAAFKAGLLAPDVTIVKGREITLPAQLVKMADDGTRTNVDVAYSMSDADGVVLDDAKKTIKVENTCEAEIITLTATEKEGNDKVEFSCRIFIDNNKITLKIHYHRDDEAYEGWNIWGWKTGADGAGYEFADEEGEKVVTIELDDARANSDYNYIVRRREGSNDWAEQTPDSKIDLLDVLSGTVHFYIEAGVPGGTRVLGDDVLIGAKVLSADYDSENGHIIVTTGMEITGNAKDAFTLMSSGEKLALKKVNTNGSVYELITTADLTTMEAKAKSYTLIFEGFEYSVRMPSAYSTDEFEEQYTYDGNDLGAVWTSEKTTFKVWAPTADSVQVKLYTSGTAGTDDCIGTLDMTKGDQGVWSAEKEGDQNGVYYTYSVRIGSKTTEACDPYAVTTGVNGNRAMVINLDSTDPDGWAGDHGTANDKYTDAVIYELHVRDFSIDESSGIQNKGKFLGLTEKGTKSSSGQTTGLDYLVDLGVTHLHLLPSYDYATVDETQLDKPQYNWGYDPKNYNVPEGSYSTDPYNGAVRVKEMKQMVKTLHDNDINVIMDVVYNHVYSATDFCFNQIVPQYFSRTNTDGSYSNGSGCGNDTASERSMVKKYIVDSVNYWADEYHIDGFRFDLVGLLDTETINEVVSTVHAKHPNVIFYGEGWDMSTTVTKDGYTMATQKNSAQTPGFAFFSDTIRDLLKGSVFDANSTGFISGAGRADDVAKNFKATPGWTSNPTQIINYASCHDNYTLKDKLNVSRADATESDRIRMNNLAAAVYMLSEGIPLIHAGEEILRTKVDEDGNIIHNSYNSSDYVNSIKWSDLDNEDYRKVRDYYKGLIAFRKNHAALRLDSASDITKNINSYTIDDQTVMIVIDGKNSISSEVSDGIIVIFNADSKAKEINLYETSYGIAGGSWDICINDQSAGTKALGRVAGGKVTVAPISALVLVKSSGEGLWVDAIEDQVYTGKALKPEIKVYDGEKLLSLNKDYTVTYKDNVNAGSATATIKGKGSYSGSIPVGFNILGKDLDDEDISISCPAVAEPKNSKAVVPSPVVTRDGVKLKPDKDYTVDYQPGGYQESGVYNIEVKAKGNYTGSRKIKFIVASADQVLMSKVTIKKIPNQKYSDYENGVIEPPLTVTYQGKAVDPNEYTIKYSNNTSVGKTATVTITGAGAKYVGDKTATFKITGTALKARDIVLGNASNLVYNGNAHTPEVSINGLTEDVDYTVTYQNNKNAGTATVLVKGQKGYTGTVKKTFKIAAFDIKNGNTDDTQAFTYASGMEAPYAKGGSKLTDEILQAKFNGVQMVQGVDYTLSSYSNNKKTGTATVKIKGKGNFKGTTDSITFEVVKQDLANLKDVSAADILVKNARKYDTVNPVVKDLDGKVLKKGTDYTLSYSAYMPGSDEEISNITDSILVEGTKIKVTAKAVDSSYYTNETSAYFKIINNNNSLSKAVIKVDDQYYTGYEIEPHGTAENVADRAVRVSVKIDGKTLDLREDIDYEIIRYDKNINKGTAKLTIHGIGDYGGTKTGSFKIKQQSMKLYETVNNMLSQLMELFN